VIVNPHCQFLYFSDVSHTEVCCFIHFVVGPHRYDDSRSRAEGRPLKALREAPAGSGSLGALGFRPQTIPTTFSKLQMSKHSQQVSPEADVQESNAETQRTLLAPTSTHSIPTSQVTPFDEEFDEEKTDDQQPASKTTVNVLKFAVFICSVAAASRLIPMYHSCVQGRKQIRSQKFTLISQLLSKWFLL
jgi:hypothetical protein